MIVLGLEDDWKRDADGLSSPTTNVVVDIGWLPNQAKKRARKNKKRGGIVNNRNLYGVSSVFFRAFARGLRKSTRYGQRVFQVPTVSTPQDSCGRALRGQPPQNSQSFRVLHASIQLTIEDSMTSLQLQSLSTVTSD